MKIIDIIGLMLKYGTSEQIFEHIYDYELSGPEYIPGAEIVGIIIIFSYFLGIFGITTVVSLILNAVSTISKRIKK